MNTTTKNACIPPKNKKTAWSSKVIKKIQDYSTHLFSKLPIGARVLKTAIAMVVSMAIGNIFGIGSGFTATPAMWGMQPTVGDSVESAKRMMKMQILSFIPVFALGLTLGPNMLSIFIGVILVFQMSIRLKLTRQCIIGIVTVTIILTSPKEIFLKQALLRSVGILIGLLTAIVINRLIAPPQYRTAMVKQAVHLNRMLMRNFREAVNMYIKGEKPTEAYKEDLMSAMMAEYNKFSHFFSLYKNEQLNLWEDEKQVAVNDPFDWDRSRTAEEKFFEEYKELCHGLIIRIRETWSLTEEKLRRLQRWKDIDMTELDQEVFNLVEVGLDRLEECNQELTNKILGEPPRPFQDPHIWHKMDELLTKWHADSAQSRNDLHSLVEISLITYRIRWSIKGILKMLIMEPCEMEKVYLDE